jgi:hypothetical protein
MLRTQVYHGDYPVIAQAENRPKNTQVKDFISVAYKGFYHLMWYFRYRRREA